MQVFDEPHALPRFQQICDFPALAVAHLKRKQAAGLETISRLRNQPAVDIKPRGPRKQGAMRLMLANLRMQVIRLSQRNIGRITDHSIEQLARTSFTWLNNWYVQQIGFDKMNATGKTMVASIHLGNRKRLA